MKRNIQRHKQVAGQVFITTAIVGILAGCGLPAAIPVNQGEVSHPPHATATTTVSRPLSPTAVSLSTTVPAAPTIAATQSPQPTTVDAQPVQPILGFTPQVGTVGTIVRVWGSGYKAGKPVVIRLGQPRAVGEVLVSAVADAQGKWNTQLAMPDRLPSGELIPTGQIHLVAMNDQNVPLASAPFDYSAATEVTPPTREGAVETVRELLTTWNQGQTVRPFLAQNLRQELDAGRPPDQLLGLHPIAMHSFQVHAAEDRPSEVLFVPTTLQYGSFTEERTFTLGVENGEWRINDSFQTNPGPAEPINVMLDWQGLRIPIPAIYTSSPINEGAPEINGAPILAKLRVMRLMGAGPSAPVKLPTPVLFYVVEYDGGLQAWMDNLYAPNIDRAQFKIKTRTVAGLPAMRYDPGDPDGADPVEHVVELASDKLLLISSDQTYPEHQQIIDGIVRP